MEPLQSSGCGCTKPASSQAVIEKNVQWGKMAAPEELVYWNALIESIKMAGGEADDAKETDGKH